MLQESLHTVKGLIGKNGFFVKSVCSLWAFFNCLQKFFRFLDALWKAKLVENQLLGNQFLSCYYKEAGLLPWSFCVLIQREKNISGGS